MDCVECFHLAKLASTRHRFHASLRAEQERYRQLLHETAGRDVWNEKAASSLFCGAAQGRAGRLGYEGHSQANSLGLLG